MASRRTAGRPAAGGLVADAARAETLAGRGLDLLVRQLATPDLTPPTDYQWTQTRRLVADLVAGEEAIFRERLAALVPPVLLPPLWVPLAQADAALIRRALGRVEEHRLATGLRNLGDRVPLEPMAAGDAEAAALELALLRADSRRLDPFGDPVLVATDLDAEDIHRLVWRIAAAARAVLLTRGEAEAQVDGWIVVAARHCLSRHDEGEGAEPAAMRLAARLLGRDVPVEELLASALSAARPGLAAALLARAAAIDHRDALAALGDVDRTALLMRVVGIGRTPAATLLLRLADALGCDDDKLVATVDAYDALNDDMAVSAVRRMRLDPGYRAAIAEQGAA